MGHRRWLVAIGLVFVQCSRTELSRFSQDAAVHSVNDVPNVANDAPDPPAGPAPRLIAPVSLGDVTLTRPTLRWELPAEIDGALVELCSDRACTQVLESLRVRGNSVRPEQPLPARSVVFWRARAMLGDRVLSGVSATWLFHVPVSDASAGVDSSGRAHLDVNGDGYDDVAVRRTLSGQPPSVSVFLGSANGLSGATMDVAFVGGDPSFGEYLSSVGDVNGDGFGDLAVQQDDPLMDGGIFESSVHLVLGTNTGNLRTVTRFARRFGGANDYWETVTGGDFNGDGYSDVAVGAEPVQLIRESERPEYVAIFRGSATITQSEAAVILRPTPRGDRFGVAIANLGDANGDGFEDLVVGAPFTGYAGDPNRIFGTGKVFVFYGTPALFQPDRFQAIEGRLNYSHFGYAVSGAGDINHDGYSDLIASAHLSSGMNQVEGSVSVFYGSADGISDVAAWTVHGSAAQERFGREVRGRDVNGDGYSDVLVASTDNYSSNAVARAALFLSGVGGLAQDPTFVQELAPAHARRHPSFVLTDTNRDGYVDFITGIGSEEFRAPWANGVLRIYGGSNTGLSRDRFQVVRGAPGEAEFGRVIGGM